jgi:hypothetical protein
MPRKTGINVYNAITPSVCTQILTYFQKKIKKNKINIGVCIINYVPRGLYKVFEQFWWPAAVNFLPP